MEPPDVDAHLGAQRGVEVRERLVEEEDVGRRTMARPMATRWRCPPESCFGRRSSSLLEAEHRAASSMRFSISARRRPAQLEPEGEVVAHREVRVERVALEHHRDVAIARGKRGHVAAGERRWCRRRPPRAPRRGGAAWTCRSRSGRPARRSCPRGSSRSTPARIGVAPKLFLMPRAMHCSFIACVNSLGHQHERALRRQRHPQLARAGDDHRFGVRVENVDEHGSALADLHAACPSTVVLLFRAFVLITMSAYERPRRRPRARRRRCQRLLRRPCGRVAQTTFVSP